MQTAKNLFLWPGRHAARKVLEFPLTLLLEVLWPKRRILEVYLNVAEWGDGIYGAEAAAQHHFGKPARDLTRREAARLRSEEHTSELQSLMRISYAVFCLKKKTRQNYSKDRNITSKYKRR